MAATKVRLGDQEWTFDEENIDLNDAFLIKSGTGLALRPFLQGVADLDPHCLQGLVWFLRRKTGEQVDINTISFRLADLDVTQADDPPALAVATG